MKSSITCHLISLMNTTIPKVTDEVEWEYIVRVARNSSMLSRLAAIFVDAPNRDKLPDYVKSQFDASLRPAKLQSQQVAFETEELAKLINSVSGCQPIFLKGAAYSLSGYTVSKGRTFSDIDLLVPKQILDLVEKKLLVYGWIADKVDEYDQMYYRKWAHEIPPLRHCSRQTLLDVHHNLVPLISGKAPDISLFTQETVAVYDGKAKVLSPYAMTLHSAVHLFYQEEYHNGFRDLADLNLMFIEFGHNKDYWQSLFDLAEKSDFKLELALACRYSSLLFDSPIPVPWLQKSTMFIPSKIKLILLDWIFVKVLQPHHPLCNIKSLALANSLATLRGHWIKMPLHILIIHTTVKTYKGLVELVAGRGALKKTAEKKSADNLQDF
jgi:hypothetical protein